MAKRSANIIGRDLGGRNGHTPALRKGAIGAAGAAAVGAAAAAGKSLLHRHATRRDELAAREFRLHPNETAPDGVRRIARGQIDLALDCLRSGGDRETGVHEARKALKRLRAVLRLVRDDLDPDRYRHDLRTFRDIGRGLAVARDSQVALETLEAVAERFSDELRPEQIDDLRARLHAEHDEAQQRLETDEAVLQSAISQLEAARARVSTWSLAAEDFDALSPGLQRIYRRGRHDAHRVLGDATTENLHELRKRVKDLWYASQILRGIVPAGSRRAAHDLSDLLGEDHDLAHLRTQALRLRREFVDRTSLTALTALIDRRRAQLRKDALDQARHIYARKPRRFVRVVEGRWRERRPTAPSPVAG
jgi:hypothetical protein